MSAYTERSRAISRAALVTVCRILKDSETEYRVIGGCAVLMVLEDSAGERAFDYVGTLDVDIATGDPQSRNALERTLLDAGARHDPDDADRVWIPIELDGERVEAPVDVVASQLVMIAEASGDIPALPLPALLLSKMRPYGNKGAKGKDGYDAYMLLAHAASSPEKIARAAIEVLPRALAEELLKLTNVFFVMKRRAARDAAMLLRDYHGVNRNEALREAVHLAQRLVQELQRLLGA